MHLATTLLKIRRQVDQVASVLASANEQKENEEVQETKPSVRLSRRIDRAHRGPRLAKHS